MSDAFNSPNSEDVTLILTAQQIKAILLDKYYASWPDGNPEQAEQFADSAALAIYQAGATVETQQLRQELLIKTQVLAALQEVNHRLHGTIELKPTAERALRLAAQAVGAEVGLLYLVDKADPNQLNCLAVHPLVELTTLAENLQTIKVGQGVPGRAAQTGQSILISDVVEYAKEAPDVLINPDPTWRSRLAVPLILAENTIGVITLVGRLPNQFSIDQLHFAEIMAGQVAALVQRATQVESQREQEQLKAVLALARKIAHDLNQPLTILLGELDLATQLELPLSSETMEQLKETVSEIARMVREYQRIVRFQITEPVPGISVLDYEQK